MTKPANESAVNPDDPGVHPLFDLAAELLDTLADLRRHYSPTPESLAPFDIIQVEVDAMRSAADKLRYPSNGIMVVPTWTEHEWDAKVADIRARVERFVDDERLRTWNDAMDAAAPEG